MEFFSKLQIISFCLVLTSNSKYLLIEFEESRSSLEIKGRSLDYYSSRSLGTGTNKSFGDDIISRSSSSVSELLQHPNIKLINKKGCGTDRQKYASRIIGGMETKRGEFPWLALMRPLGATNWNCGGSLISCSWVLTAAHCVTEDSGDCHPLTCSLNTCKTFPDKARELMFGQHDIRERSKNIIVISEKILPHKEFNYCSGKSDVALIKLKKSVLTKTSKNVNTICLPVEYPEELSVGLKATVAGHGNTKVVQDSSTGQWSSEKSSNIMKKLDSELVKTEDCIKAHYHPLGGYTLSKEQNLCLRVLEGQDACHGDSGGPLMTFRGNSAPSKRKEWFQIGVVSWGNDKCGVEGVPGIYTNVKTYMKWILDNIY